MNQFDRLISVAKTWVVVHQHIFFSFLELKSFSFLDIAVGGTNSRGSYWI